MTLAKTDFVTHFGDHWDSRRINLECYQYLSPLDTGAVLNPAPTVSFDRNAKIATLEPVKMKKKFEATHLLVDATTLGNDATMATAYDTLVAGTQSFLGNRANYIAALEANQTTFILDDLIETFIKEERVQRSHADGNASIIDGDIYATNKTALFEHIIEQQFLTAQGTNAHYAMSNNDLLVDIDLMGLERQLGD